MGAPLRRKFAKHCFDVQSFGKCEGPVTLVNPYPAFRRKIVRKQMPVIEVHKTKVKKAGGILYSISLLHARGRQLSNIEHAHPFFLLGCLHTVSQHGIAKWAGSSYYIRTGADRFIRSFPVHPCCTFFFLFEHLGTARPAAETVLAA